MVALECQVCCQADLFVKGSGHRHLYSTVFVVINQTLKREREVTCFRAKTRGLHLTLPLAVIRSATRR